MTLVPQGVVFLPTTSSCKSFFPNIEDGNENVSESGFIGICWQKSALTKWIPIRCMAISPADNNASSGLASRKMSPAHILHFFFLLFYFLVFSSYWLHILGIFLDSPSDNLIKGIPLTQTIMHHVVWLPLQEVSPSHVLSFSFYFSNPGIKNVNKKWNFLNNPRKRMERVL